MRSKGYVVNTDDLYERVLQKLITNDWRGISPLRFDEQSKQLCVHFISAKKQLRCFCQKTDWLKIDAEFYSIRIRDVG